MTYKHKDTDAAHYRQQPPPVAIPFRQIRSNHQIGDNDSDCAQRKLERHVEPLVEFRILRRVVRPPLRLAIFRKILAPIRSPS